MIETLATIGAVIVAIVTFVIKRLQKKVKKQENTIKDLETIVVQKEAKDDALVNRIKTEEKLHQKETNQIDGLKEASNVEEIIDTINADISDFNAK